MNKPENIDQYIASFAPEIQAKLQTIRQTIRQAAPDATETISYGMPAFKQRQMLVYFAAFSKHIGLYPTSSGIVAFRDELTKYKTSKGAIQIPLDAELPTDLITKIVRFRLEEVDSN